MILATQDAVSSLLRFGWWKPGSLLGEYIDADENLRLARKHESATDAARDIAENGIRLFRCGECNALVDSIAVLSRSNATLCRECSNKATGLLGTIKESKGDLCQK